MQHLLLHIYGSHTIQVLLNLEKIYANLEKIDLHLRINPVASVLNGHNHLYRDRT